MRATESPAPGPRHIVEHGLDWTGMFNLVHMLYNMSCPPTDVRYNGLKDTVPKCNFSEILFF